jgi:hypothetical protein
MTRPDLAKKAVIVCALALVAVWLVLLVRLLTSGG